eukprot:UN25598
MVHLSSVRRRKVAKVLSLQIPFLFLRVLGIGFSGNATGILLFNPGIKTFCICVVRHNRCFFLLPPTSFAFLFSTQGDHSTFINGSFLLFIFFLRICFCLQSRFSPSLFFFFPSGISADCRLLFFLRLLNSSPKFRP